MSITELIKGCQKLNPECQRILVLQYSSELLTVSRRYTPSEMDAEDVLQDGFIKIFKAIKNFDESKGLLVNWMRKIIINTALKRLNKSCFKNELFVESLPVTAVDPVVYAQLDAEEIMKLIACLPDGYRQVFNLYAVEGYSHKEIGQLLEIAEVTSRSNYSRAKSLLKKKLSHHKSFQKWVKIG